MFDLFPRFDRDVRFLEPKWTTTTTFKTLNPEKYLDGIRVHRAGGQIVVEFDLPGVKKDAASVTYDERTRVIEVSGTAESEWRTHTHSYKFRLPVEANRGNDEIVAVFEDGVLRLTMSATAVDTKVTIPVWDGNGN